MVDDWYTKFKLYSRRKCENSLWFHYDPCKGNETGTACTVEGAPAIGALVDGVVYVAAPDATQRWSLL